MGRACYAQHKQVSCLVSSVEYGDQGAEPVYLPAEQGSKRRATEERYSYKFMNQVVAMRWSLLGSLRTRSLPRHKPPIILRATLEHLLLTLNPIMLFQFFRTRYHIGEP
jgi:hypothetical protein